MPKENYIRNVDFVPLLVRIVLAVVFIYHGYPKIFGDGHAKIAEMMAQNLHLDPQTLVPQALGWAAAIAEFGGGIMIGIGLLSRLWALGILTNMVVAFVLVHGKYGFSMANQGYEYVFVLGLLALAILVGGPGRLSLDGLIFRRKPAPTKEYDVRGKIRPQLEL